MSHSEYPSPSDIDYIEKYYASRELKGQKTHYKSKIQSIPHFSNKLKSHINAHITKMVKAKFIKLTFVRKGKYRSAYYSYEFHRFVTSEGTYKSPIEKLTFTRRGKPATAYYNTKTHKFIKIVKAVKGKPKPKRKVKAEKRISKKVHVKRTVTVKRKAKIKRIHEGYYIEYKKAREQANKLNGTVKKVRSGLYKGSYEVFAPIPKKIDVVKEEMREMEG